MVNGLFRIPFKSGRLVDWVRERQVWATSKRWMPLGVLVGRGSDVLMKFEKLSEADYVLFYSILDE